MAEPTVDSLNTGTGGGVSTVPPLTGEGSKTPPTPGKGLGAGTPLGGDSSISPMGTPGAPSKQPPTPEEQQADALTNRAAPVLVNNISKAIEEDSDILSEDESESDSGAAVEEAMNIEASVRFAEMSDKKIEKLVNYLLDLGWTEKVLKNLIKKTDLEPKEFFRQLVDKIKSSGEAEANEFLKSKMQPEGDMGLTTPPPETPPMGATPAPPASPAGGPTPPPPPALASGIVKASLADVGLKINNNNMREAIMKEKVIVTKEGTLEKVSDNSNVVLSKLVLAIRNAKSAMNSVEEEKLRYAGMFALKFAAREEEENEEAEEGEDEGDDLDFGKEDEGDDFGGEDEGAEDIDKEKLLAGIDTLKGAIDEIESAIKGVESEMEAPGMEMSPEGFGAAEGIMGMGKDMMAKAREAIKTAKADMKKLDEKNDKKKDKKKGKGGKDAMSMAMGTGKKSAGSKCDEKDEKKKMKDDEKKKEDKKKASEGASDDLIQKVKARLAKFREEREEKEALYPDKDKLRQTIDKINVEGGNIKDIGSEPASDKDGPTINAKGISQKDLPYKTEGTATTEKSIPIKSKAGSDALQNVFDKARLSVELASQQQLRGLIDNPLKEAMVKNMVEVGINEDTAKDIAHNAFLDGYEATQKIIIKEAFETFMAKPYDDFVKVAKFTKDYVGREDVLASVADEETRTKQASVAPLRGSSVEGSGDGYKRYWSDVQRNRRGF